MMFFPIGFFYALSVLKMDINELTGIVINKCIKIHSKMGPGCFERVYEELLYYELTKTGLGVIRHILLPIDYEDLHIERAYNLDLLVEEMLVLELKTLCPWSLLIRSEPTLFY